MARGNEAITQPYQIICEGFDDREFFLRLLQNRAISNCQIGCGRIKDGPCLGNSGFSHRIQAIKGSGVEPIRGYLILADSDDDPGGRFVAAQGHLRSEQLAVPAQPLTIATGADGTKTAIVMIPSPNEHGGLESLLLACCDGVNEFKNCRDAFCDCITTEKRKLDHDKFRLRTLIAATKPSDPGMSINFWVTSKERPFPMTHPALDTIANFLLAFCQD